MKGRFILFFILVLSLIGCNNQSDRTTNETLGNSSEGILIKDFADRTVQFDSHPNRIATLSNGDLDIIYALGEKVVGRPAGESVISEATEEVEIGSTHSVDLEKLTSVEPDVVLGNFPMNSKDVQAVEALGAKMVLTSANSVEDIQKQISLLGKLVGKENEAKQLMLDIENKINEIQDSMTKKHPRVLLIYGAPGMNMVALPNSLSGNILELAGGENIASDYPSLEMYPQYAQLNTERIIEANPQLILLMSHGNPEEVKESLVKEMSQIAGWDELDAIKNDQFIILPSNLFGTNPGTKVVDALDYLHDLLKDVKE